MVNQKRMDAYFRKRVDLDLDGKDILRNGTEDIDVWPKYCVRSGSCINCSLTGKVPCHPRFRS